MDRWGVDVCVTGSQKCLAAPPGLSLLSLSKKAAEFVRKNPPRVRYFDLARQLDFLAHGETPFTPAISLYYALDEALDMLIEEGLEKRVERHARARPAGSTRSLGGPGPEGVRRPEGQVEHRDSRALPGRVWTTSSSGRG